MTATWTTPQSSPRLSVSALPRRVPAPAAEPPYDDERGHSTPLTDGALALDLTDDVTVPERAARDSAGQRHLTVVGSRPPKPRTEDSFFAPQPTPRVALPDPYSWTGRFVQAVVEVLAGERPVTQLLRWTNEGVYADVTRRARALGRLAPGARRGRGRALVRSVHLCEPRDGVVEAAVHVKEGGRSRAIALRLEGLDGRWRCTALVLG